MEQQAARETILHQVKSPYHADPEGIAIDHVAEKKLVRKLDLYIIPIAMLLYLFSFLDR